MSVCVAAFPLHRRRNLVEEVSRGLSQYQRDEAASYWRGTAKELLRQLVATGISLETAQQEVRQLLYAALDEMQRQHSKLHA
jgi:hypothetical protein